MLSYRWFCSVVAGCLAAELGISPLVTGILLERGLNDTESMREFLYGSLTPFHDPFLLKDMEKAVRRIESALAAGEKITVYGDYDVDGISASSLLYIYLQDKKMQEEIIKLQTENKRLEERIAMLQHTQQLHDEPVGASKAQAQSTVGDDKK